MKVDDDHLSRMLDTTTREEKIKYLLTKKIKVLILKPESCGFEFDDSEDCYDMDIRLDEFCKNGIETYNSHLGSLPDKEIDRLYHTSKSPEERQAEEIERNAFYNQSNAVLDADCWKLCEYWSVDEATAISLGKDPRVVSLSSFGGQNAQLFLAKQYKDRHDLL